MGAPGVRRGTVGIPDEGNQQGQMLQDGQVYMSVCFPAWMLSLAPHSSRKPKLFLQRGQVEEAVCNTHTGEQSGRVIGREWAGRLGPQLVCTAGWVELTRSLNVDLRGSWRPEAQPISHHRALLSSALVSGALPPSACKREGPRAPITRTHCSLGEQGLLTGKLPPILPGSAGAWSAPLSLSEWCGALGKKC